MDKPFGKKITMELERREMSHAEFARQIGVSETTVCRYTKGMRIPNGEILRKICRVLNVSANYLLGISKKKDACETYIEVMRNVCEYRDQWDNDKKRAIVNNVFGVGGEERG